MTPFSPPAAYTPPPPAASISRSDRLLASTYPARNGTNNGHIKHSTNNSTYYNNNNHIISTSIPPTTITHRNFSTTTTTADACRQGEEAEEERQGQKQKQKQKQKQQGQEQGQEQGPCTISPSPTFTRTPSNTLIPTLTPIPDNDVYYSSHSRPRHMHPQHYRPPQQRQHSLSHKKDAPYYYPSQQHVQSHLYYTPSAQHPFVSLQREPSIQSYSSKQGGAQPSLGLVRSPDPRYLEAFEGYYDHSELEEFAVLDIQPGDETHSDDEHGEDEEGEEDPRARWVFFHKPPRDGPKRERRRSRSVCGMVSPLASPTPSSPWTSPSSCVPYDELATPMTRASSLLVSPAMDGTLTTPPPSARVSFTPRRRHHSCVAPNTKEFETLATIFGWVTDASASYTWPIRSDDHDEKETIEGIYDSAPPSRYLSSNQNNACASDEDSDLDDCFRQGSSSASRCTSCESRGSELSQGRVEGRSDHNPQSSNGPIDFLNESSDGKDPVARWSASKSTLDKWQTGILESENVSPNETSSSSSMTPIPPQPFSIDGLLQDVRSRAIDSYQAPAPIVDPDELFSTIRQPRRASSLRRSDTMSTGHDSTESFSPLDSEHLESPLTQCSNSTLMSPLTCCHGKDSGYMSFAYNRHGQPLEALTTSVAQSLNALVDQPDHLLEDVPQPAVPDSTVPTEDWTTSASDATGAPPVPPHIPPRYPEIDLRVFDHPENESTESIVYAPLEGLIRESLTGTLELRPIVAATIVKLIEKLTHYYGMDSGFMADFFLTYRLFMSPVQLCKYLIQRYLWALEEDSEFRCVVRVRTFVVFRFWINNHFADDFLTSKSLRFQMASFLNEMRFNTRVQASQRDSRIIRNLMEFFKDQRRYYKGLAHRSATAEMERNYRHAKYDNHHINNGNDSGHTCDKIGSTNSSSERMADPAASVEAVERLRVSIVHRQMDPISGKATTSDLTEAPHASNPSKGRHRAYTLGGMITKPASGDSPGKHTHTKPPSSKEPRPAHQMGRQASEGGMFMARKRQLSSSSVKSNRSTNNWSTKFVNKIRQKSEDFYQQIVHPSGSQHKADSKQCVCWTLAYIGISEHHALNTARSFPNLRPSVVSNHHHHQQQQQQQQDTIGSGAGSNASSSIPGIPSNKSIKRLKSSLSLGLHSNSTAPSPTPSPTRNQFSGISSRHSRSNSNSSVGYHPNPECPYHTPCLESIQTETMKGPSEACESSASSATFTTLKEALQEDEISESVSSQPSTGGIIPPSPVWNYGPWYSSTHQLFPTLVPPPPYKPFILFYRSQAIAQQLCLLEQHFLENVKWDELLEVELCRAGRKSRSKVESSISGYLFRAEGEPNGMDASNERSNMLCMWVASEVVSTRFIDDRVRVIEKFIRIAQKCYQYRNFSSLMQLVMGLGSSPLCGLRRTWARVGSYEMRVLQDLQDFISPFGNWSDLRKAMNQVGYQETAAENGQRLSVQGSDFFSSSNHGAGQEANSTSSNIHTPTEPGHSKYLQYQAPLNKQGCIPFLGLFVFDLTHIAVSPSWFLPQVASATEGSDPDNENGSGDAFQNGVGSVPPTPMKANHMATAARLEAPDPKDLQGLMPTGTLLVHFYRYQLIAKTIKWFMAFQQRSPKYMFPVDSTLYSKCFLLRVLTKERVKELAVKCESE